MEVLQNCFEICILLPLKIVTNKDGRENNLPNNRNNFIGK